jgi:hypothetical protein
MPGLEAASTIESAVATPIDTGFTESTSVATTKEPTPVLDAGIASPYSRNLPTVIADNIAPELRPATDAINTTVRQASPHRSHADSSQASASLSINSINFVPYTSPLKMFKAYRYHSNFRNDVPGGFKSLTYSNTIDPGLPLCPVEMAGDSCEDPDCIGQHMRNMGLAGTSVVLSSSPPQIEWSNTLGAY